MRTLPECKVVMLFLHAVCSRKSGNLSAVFEGDEPCFQVPGTVANVVKLLLVVRYSILLIGLNVDCM